MQQQVFPTDIISRTKIRKQCADLKRCSESESGLSDCVFSSAVMRKTGVLCLAKQKWMAQKWMEQWNRLSHVFETCEYDVARALRIGQTGSPGVLVCKKQQNLVVFYIFVLVYISALFVQWVNMSSQCWLKLSFVLFPHLLHVYWNRTLAKLNNHKLISNGFSALHCSSQ